MSELYRDKVVTLLTHCSCNCLSQVTFRSSGAILIMVSRLVLCQHLLFQQLALSSLLWWPTCNSKCRSNVSRGSFHSSCTWMYQQCNPQGLVLRIFCDKFLLPWTWLWYCSFEIKFTIHLTAWSDILNSHNSCQYC